MKTSYGEIRYRPENLTIIRKFFTDNHLHGNLMLDMGCGYGYYSFIGKDYYDNVIAVDINPPSVMEARKRVKDSRIEVELGRIEKYSTTKRFDLILCLLMVRRRHPTSRINIETIDNMVKLLSDKGILIIDVWADIVKDTKQKFNVVKESSTIELPNHIVNKQKRLYIKR